MNRLIKIALWTFLPLAAALECGPSFAAFRIIQATGADYVPVSQTVACGAGMCRTSLEPLRVISLGAGNRINTMRMKTDLFFQREPFTIDSFGGSLNINFKITNYPALTTER